MYKYIFFQILFLISITVSSQSNDETTPPPIQDAEGVVKEEDKKENVWKTLSKITYKKEFDEFLGFKIDVPVFADAVKALNNKEIEVKGYIIPVEGYQSHTEFIFSAFPYNMCFFCGGAGPETIMEVYTKEEIDYTAEAVIVKGVLKLNDSDINRLIYALEDVELVDY